MNMAPGGATSEEQEAMASSKYQLGGDEEPPESDDQTQLVCLLDDNQFEVVTLTNHRSSESTISCDEFEFPVSPGLSLNTKQLKDLLDEAFAYKNPKDRVGKSKVFLDLLSEAESAERADEDLATRRPRTRASESNVAGGSLQNISQAVDSDSHSGARRRQKTYKGAGGSVSARQREGGSLPCNVNANWPGDLREGREVFIMSTGEVIEADITITTDDSDTLDSNTRDLFGPENSDLPQSNSFCYEEEDVVDGKIINPPIPRARGDTEERIAPVAGSNIYYDPGAGPSHADDRHVHALYRTSASLEVGDEFPEGAHMNGMGSSEVYEGNLLYNPDRSEYSMHRRGCKADCRHDDVASTSKAGCSKKNNKRKNKNVALSRKSEEMPGYRGDMDLDTVLNFIENDGKMKAMGFKKQLSKQKVQEKKQKALQKASSLEELSQRNIEDLTESCKTDCWADQVLIRSESQNDISTRSPVPVNVPIDDRDDNNDNEFQMVRKKHRRRRVAEAVGKRVRRRGATQRSPRRKSTSSVPHSEHSAESDLDSVHSLPAHGARASDSDCDTSCPPLESRNECQLRTEDFPCLPVKPVVTKNETSSKNDKTGFKSEPVKSSVKPEIVKPKAEAPKAVSHKMEVYRSGYSRPDNPKTYARSEYLKYRQDAVKVTKDVVPKCIFSKPELKRVPAAVRIPPIAITQLPVAKSDHFISKEPIKPQEKSQTEVEIPKPVVIKNPIETAIIQPSPEVIPAVPPKPVVIPPQSVRHETSRAEHKTDIKPKTRSKSVGPNTRPPVILMDDRRSQDNAPCELTFGFEVNMQLLNLNDKATGTSKINDDAQVITTEMPIPSQGDEVNVARTQTVKPEPERRPLISQRSTPEILEEPSQITEEAPQLVEPPPQFAEPPPQFAEPPLRLVEPPPQIMEQPPQYVEQPPQYVEPSPQYVEPSQQYVEPSPRYMEPAPQYMEQPTQYMEPPPPMREQASYSCTPPCCTPTPPVCTPTPPMCTPTPPICTPPPPMTAYLLPAVPTVYLPALMATPVSRPLLIPNQLYYNQPQMVPEVYAPQPTEIHRPKVAQRGNQGNGPYRGRQNWKNVPFSNTPGPSRQPGQTQTEPQRRRQHLHRPGIDYSRPEAPQPYYVLSDYFKKPNSSVKQNKKAKKKQVQQETPAAESAQIEVPAKKPAQPKEQPECATCAGSQSNSSHVERRTSDVMTSTEDLETVMASQRSTGVCSIPPLAENPAEAENADERLDLEKIEGEDQEDAASNCEESDEGAATGEDDEYDSEDSGDDSEALKNPYYPYANKNHMEVVKFNEELWQKAVNDPDTVWYGGK